MADAPTKQRRVDSKQLVRQWAILRLLTGSTRGYSVKELADQLVVSKPTIERDLATLEQEFALVEESEGKQKKLYRISEEIRALGSIQFGPMELLSIHAAMSATSAMSGTELHGDLQKVMRKLRGFLSERHNGGLTALASVFAPHVRGAVDYAQHGELVDVFVDAIARRRWCRLEYRKAGSGDTKTHRLRLLRMLWHRGALYLLGSIEGYNDITTFAVHRCMGATLEDEEFPPPRLDVTAFIEKAFGIFVSDDEEDVEILFDSEIAWKLDERTFHPAEEKEVLDDGRLRYRLRSSAQWEIVPWVLSYGGLAELVAPASWRASIAGAAEALASKHAVVDVPEGETTESQT